MRIRCNGCGNMVEIVEKAGFRQTCEVCDTWLHSCVHCSFWSGSHCSETAAERISDPEAQNFCEWYKASAEPFDSAQGPEPAEGGEGRSAEKDGDRSSAEEMWQKLVKKKEESGRREDEE